MSELSERERDDPQLRFSSLARNDIKEILLYAAEYSEDAAQKLIRAIFEKCEMLSRNPGVGRIRDDLILGLRHFPYKNYNIFYFPAESGIEIYRVLHASRDLLQVFDDVIDDAN